MSDPYDTASDGSERRTFFRVLTRIPVRCRVVSQDESEAIAREILERRSPDVSHLDPALSHWLSRIERKLDRMLVQMDIGDPVVFSEDDVQEVMLSGSGMGFATGEEISPGSLVQVAFELPGPPEHRVRCIGKVIRTLPPKREGEPEVTAVAFHVIHDGDRDAIVRHAVEVQRVLIRSRSQRDAG